MWDDKISFHKRRDEDRGQNETRVRYERMYKNVIVNVN